MSAEASPRSTGPAVETAAEAFRTVLDPHTLVKPKLRGVLHQWSALVAVVMGVVLCSLAPGSQARVAVVIYAASLLACFGVSALYHRVTWTRGRRQVLKRLDHSMIFVLIAGTYTPFCVLALTGATRTAVLLVIWVGAAAGVAVRMAWLASPRWLVVPIYIGLGWTAAFIIPQLIEGAGVASVVLLIVGGAFYSSGAVIYAAKRPNPAPATFGYHELFHAFTVTAAVCHAVAVFLVLY